MEKNGKKNFESLNKCLEIKFFKNYKTHKVFGVLRFIGKTHKVFGVLRFIGKIHRYFIFKIPGFLESKI
jgi:hypothetical protein